ncbi:MAG: archaeosortase/exosortase family protein [Thaumarchaeota archaeon]|nr:archaeosortase/exosortase family protein [Nitrososphaerota archaeon]
MTSPAVKNYEVVVVATSATLLLYWVQAILLFSKAAQVVVGVFDTSVPAYPLVGMFFVGFFLYLRRSEMGKDSAPSKRSPSVRVLGLLVALLPLGFTITLQNPFLNSYAFAGVALVAGWFGLILFLRPTAFKLLTPYLLIYVVAVTSVDAVTITLGDPLSSIEASISAVGTFLVGLPVQWSSTSLQFTALNGQAVALYISEECSGAASISIFLLLVALAHLDLKTELRKTFIIASVGTVALLVVNAVRVVIVIGGGYFGGLDLLWSLHGWVGYALYIAFYALALVFQMRWSPGGLAPLPPSLRPQAQ